MANVDDFTETVVNAADGLTASIFLRADGQFAVTLTDTDAGATLPTIKLFPDLASARKYAESLAFSAIESGAPVSVEV